MSESAVGLQSGRGFSGDGTFSDSMKIYCHERGFAGSLGSASGCCLGLGYRLLAGDNVVVGLYAVPQVRWRGLHDDDERCVHDRCIWRYDRYI